MARWPASARLRQRVALEVDPQRDAERDRDPLPRVERRVPRRAPARARLIADWLSPTRAPKRRLGETAPRPRVRTSAPRRTSCSRFARAASRGEPRADARSHSRCMLASRHCTTRLRATGGARADGQSTPSCAGDAQHGFGAVTAGLDAPPMAATRGLVTGRCAGQKWATTPVARGADRVGAQDGPAGALGAGAGATRTGEPEGRAGDAARRRLRRSRPGRRATPRSSSRRRPCRRPTSSAAAGARRSRIVSSVMMHLRTSVRSGMSNITSSSASSTIERSARAPVLRSIATSAAA